MDPEGLRDPRSPGGPGDPRCLEALEGPGVLGLGPTFSITRITKLEEELFLSKITHDKQCQ